MVFGDPVHSPTSGGRNTTASAAAASGSGGGPDMFSVNYWTIRGDKMPPWSLKDLKLHIAVGFFLFLFF
jgi:hypothetical protein